MQTSPVLHHQSPQLCWICHEYIQIQTSPRYPCHRQLLLIGTNLICGSQQLSLHIFFLLSQKVDTASNPVIGEGVYASALLWPNGNAQFMDRNPSPALALPHAIHSCCRSVSRRADIILTAMKRMSVSLAFAIRASSFCRMIGMYEDHRILFVSTEDKFI